MWPLSESARPKVKCRVSCISVGKQWPSVTGPGELRSLCFFCSFWGGGHRRLQGWKKKQMPKDWDLRVLLGCVGFVGFEWMITSKCEWPSMIGSKIQPVPARTILSLFLQGEPPLPTIHHNTQADLGWGGACGDVKHALNKSHLVGRTWQLSMNRIFKTWVTTALFGLWLIWYLTWHYLTIYLSR